MNIVKYHDTIVSVEPKRQALSEANARLAAANEKLEKVNAHVADLARKLKILTDELEAANAQKKEAVDLVETSQLRLDLAQRLTGALGRYVLYCCIVVHVVHVGGTRGGTWRHLECLIESLGVTWRHLVSLGVTWRHLASLGVTWSHLESV